MKNHTGDIIQRCTSDIETTRNFVAGQMTSLFRIMILVVLSMIFMFSMNVPLTIIALIPMPVIVLYSIRFHNKIGEGFKECDESEGRLSAMAQENLTGVRVVRAFGRERYERDRFEQHNEEYTGLWVRLGKVMSRFWASSDVLTGLQIMLVIVFGAVFCLNGSLTAGGIADTATYALCSEALANSGNYYNLYQKLAEDGRIIPVMFGYYAVYAQRGLMPDLNPSRDNVFFYTLGKSAHDVLITE